MPLRDVLLLTIVFASVPVCLLRPFLGTVLWTWIAFMNPHRLTWGPAFNFPVAQLIAGATLVGFVISRSEKHVPRTLGTLLVLLLWAWMSLSTLQAHMPQNAHDAWMMRSKILLMLFVMMALAHDRRQIWLLSVVTALSVGFYGLKGGVFTILTGGQYRVNGPELSMLAGNNHLAVGLNMMLPLLFYLRRETEQRWLRLLLTVAFACSIVSVIGSYSRGGVLGLAAVIGVLLIKSGRKLVALVLVVCGLFAVLALAPEHWKARMETVETYQTNQSAMSRIYAWHLAWRLALARPVLGWGPEAMEDLGLYDVYYPDAPLRTDVHSAYFQLLGEGGFVTLGLWLSLNAWALLILFRLQSRFRGTEHGWIANYADMFQVGLVGYLISGAFLEVGFSDLLYQLIGLTVILVGISRRIVGEETVPTKEAPRAGVFRPRLLEERPGGLAVGKWNLNARSARDAGGPFLPTRVRKTE